MTKFQIWIGAWLGLLDSLVSILTLARHQTYWEMGYYGKAVVANVKRGILR